MMYPDVSQMYLKSSIFSEGDTCIIVSCHIKYILKESQIHVHLRYMSDTSRYMYLGRFLGVTLDT